MTEPKKRGTVTKLTPELQEKVIALIKGGNYMDTAAACVGICKRTMYNWLRDGARDNVAGVDSDYARFQAAVMQAEGEYEAARVLRITKSAQDGNAMLDVIMLSKQFPKRWGNTSKVELSGPDGGPIQNLSLDLKRLPLADLRQLREILEKAKALPPGDNVEIETDATAAAAETIDAEYEDV
jgi:hypothetical protein